MNLSLDSERSFTYIENMVSLDFAIKKIRRFYINQKRLPTYSEMAIIFRYNSKNSAYKLGKRLIKEGILQKDKSGKLLPKRLFLPLSLYGSIRAGYPAPAEDQFVDTIFFDTYLVDDPDSSYLLRVTGDSMESAGLYEGDIVVVNKRKEAYAGDIIVALVDDAWTLKYLGKEKGKPVLIPANPKYNKIYPKGELIIGGVVVSAVRKYH